jgi:hypothetical protein
MDKDNEELAEITARCNELVKGSELQMEILPLLEEVKTLHGNAYAALEKSYNAKVSEKKECNDEYDTYKKIRANFKSKMAIIKAKLDKSKIP